MEINRLSQDELSYEVQARGLKTGSVEEMRKILRGALKNEKMGNLFSRDDYPFSFLEDAEAVQKKIEEIGTLIENLRGDATSGEYRKVLTKIIWALGRLEKSAAKSEEEIEKKKKLKSDLVSALGLLDIQEENAGGTSSSDVEPEETFLPKHSGSYSVWEPTPKVPIYKWGIKFSGEKGQSLNSFLERVAELSEARGVSRQTLFKSAIDLFSDRALIWYRAYKHMFNSWSDLVRELRLEFLPPDYDERLMGEIKHRTQGQNESIGTYVAVMSSMFSRLTSPLTESEQIRILKRNINPFYQSQLGLSDVSNIKDLIDKGRKLESVRASVEAFVPPPSRRQNNLLEPDLAYVAQDNLQLSAIQRTDSRPNFSCSFCKRSGHTFRYCKQRRRCYGCGTEGTIRANCPNCRNGQAYAGDNRHKDTSGNGPTGTQVNFKVSDARASRSPNPGVSDLSTNGSLGNENRARL